MYTDGKPETVKGGQGIEQHIVVIKINMGPHLRHIGKNILVGQHHALGLAFGARGKQHHGRFFVMRPDRNGARQQFSGHRRQLIAQRQFRPHVFQINQLCDLAECGFQFLKLADFDEAVRGDDAPLASRAVVLRARFSSPLHRW